MTSRWLAVAALLAAGCSSSPVAGSASFRGPTSAAVFSGMLPGRPGILWPYLAVSNGRSDDLRIVDTETGKALYSPGHAFPLSIPTLPAPMFLASASLRDGEPDLLVVAGAGATVQLVATWEDGSDGQGPRVVGSWDLSGLAGLGSDMLSLIAVPYPGPVGGTPPVAAAAPGRALLLAGFTGGKLVVLEFARDATGHGIHVVAGSAAAQSIGFEPVSMILAPDGFHLYCATPDLVTDLPLTPSSRQVHGVAELDLSAGAPGSWTVRGLAALAPTTLVAAATVGERWVGDPERFGAPVPRVYAALDHSGCGPEQVIACGVVTIDPVAGGLAPDPAPAGGPVPAQPFRAPYALPAIAMALSVAMPAAWGAQQCLSDCPAYEVNKPVIDPITGNPGPVQPVPQPMMLLAPAIGQRWATGAAVAAAADGFAYVLDLGRWSAPNQLATLNAQASSQRLRVAAVSWFSPAGTDAKATLGLWLQYPGASDRPGLYNDSTAQRAVILTPGFTPDEIWTLTWQGALPGLVREPSDIWLLGDGSLALGLQTQVGIDWIPGPAVGDAHLGIHLGDVVEFGFTDDPCRVVGTDGTDVPHESTIRSILPAGPGQPGGALQLAVPAATDPDPTNLRCLARELTGGTSFAGRGGWATVRASGLVLVGSSKGYVGRPPLMTKADVAAPEGKRFNFSWAVESGPLDEAQILARKARRFYYPQQAPCSSGTLCEYATLYPELTDPLAPGPVVGFIAGPLCTSETSYDRVCPDANLGDLLRDTTLTFQTASGVLPMSRVSSPVALPLWAVPFDRSQLGGGEVGATWYVVYENDSVFMMAPGSFVTISATIR